MVKRVIWSKNALRDKIQILDYWHKRIGTKTYSIKLDLKLKQAVKHLKKYPEFGRILENTQIRFIVIEYYLIFYKYVGDEIRILHIWDSRRDPDELIIEG